jgi:lipoprotein-releasing system permease protein
MSVYVNFEMLQDILEMDEQQLEGGGTIPARATQVQIKLVDGVDPIETRDLLKKRWSAFIAPRLAESRTPTLLMEVEIKTWEEKQARFIAAVEKEKYLVTVLFGIISVVAVFLVGCIFHMIVQQKTRDIGIVKSVGATSFGVAQIFIAYGAAVGVVGGAIGTVFGALFVRYINEIQDLLARIHPSAVVWSPEVYTFDRIPNQVDPWDAAVIYAIAIIASMLGSVIAAIRAARVWPVEALRYE